MKNLGEQGPPVRIQDDRGHEGKHSQCEQDRFQCRHWMRLPLPKQVGVRASRSGRPTVRLQTSGFEPRTFCAILDWVPRARSAGYLNSLSSRVWREAIQQFLSAFDLFLWEPITKLAFPPGALLPGLTQRRQGSYSKQQIPYSP